MNGYVFVSVGAPAPHPDWSGRADIGVVAGQRLQLSNAGAKTYLQWVRSLGARRGRDQ